MKGWVVEEEGGGGEEGVKSVIFIEWEGRRISNLGRSCFQRLLGAMMCVSYGGEMMIHNLPFLH